MPSRKIPENDSRGSSLFENELYQNLASYQSEAPDYEHHEGEGVGDSVSLVTRNFEQAADCSYLSFGSFGSSMTALNSSGTLTSVPVKSNLEEGHSQADISSAGHVDTRHSEYYIDDSLRVTPDDRFHRNDTNGATAGPYDASSASQPEELKPKSAEVAHGNQYPFPSVNPGYTLDDAQSLNAAFNETSSQMQNLAPFSNVINLYSRTQIHHFLISLSMSAKYGNSVSSVGGSAISMSEGQEIQKLGLANDMGITSTQWSLRRIYRKEEGYTTPVDDAQPQEKNHEH